MSPLERWLTPAVRRWLYGIATAALIVLGVYGLLTNEQIAAWMGLAAAITGLATVYTDPEQPTGLPRRAMPPSESPHA